ncbi:hypothetical protein Lpp41_11668 [Lacticaseibacillus paracasei subsp. paracasei Lpp41]|uniref:Uncharacterized protein n=1 Tax=Lacticaseibacillus paracasei subsp. paracasei Lpp41 TaxID=1256208 RepID=A0A829H593_LACPA|nr:hypothetical protein LCAUW4_0184 [Lacticaseibacillus casei UW4]EKQ25393.1 hypothetical protein LCAUW1_0146 [Lacticaseibacillus paracasei]EPC71482.1 hypothetical protein Lpp41_11668 [Lacticaseibacillus paracasei subsp. paracasei Lpp41]
MAVLVGSSGSTGFVTFSVGLNSIEPFVLYTPPLVWAASTVVALTAMVPMAAAAANKTNFFIITLHFLVFIVHLCQVPAIFVVSDDAMRS